MRLIMISLDAVSFADREFLFSLPHLAKLKTESTLCTNMETIYPTITYPIHSSILTGCYPDRHGIGHNQPFQPDTAPVMRKWFWSVGDIREKTLHQAAKEKGCDVASILWPVTGKNPYTRRNFPEILPLPGENAALKMLRYAPPLWILKTELLYGKQRKSILQPDLDEYAALLTDKIISGRRPPDFLTLHLVDADATRHKYGAHSREACEAMRRLDRHVGRILDALEKKHLTDDTIFCIVSDHGQREAPNGILLNDELKKMNAGQAQTLGMGAYIFSSDLKKSRKVLEENKEKWHIAHIYTDEELRSIHAPKDVHLSVDAEDGCCFIDEKSTPHGEHGFSLSYPEAKVLLLLRGGPFKKNYQLSHGRVVDIAPTLAKAMHWDLPDTDGQVLTDAFSSL